ncbi:MAG: hypothetical protein NC218_02555 [Acetobacter sp.]|nr:hypothetical protein [Acetobacter sp.]
MPVNQAHLGSSYNTSAKWCTSNTSSAPWEIRMDDGSVIFSITSSEQKIVQDSVMSLTLY